MSLTKVKGSAFHPRSNGRYQIMWLCHREQVQPQFESPSDRLREKGQSQKDAIPRLVGPPH